MTLCPQISVPRARLNEGFGIPEAEFARPPISRPCPDSLCTSCSPKATEGLPKTSLSPCASRSPRTRLSLSDWLSEAAAKQGEGTSPVVTRAARKDSRMADEEFVAKSAVEYVREVGTQESV